MTKVEHSLKFVTEFDETHPIAQQALSIPHSDLVAMLEGMLKDLLVPAPFITASGPPRTSQDDSPSPLILVLNMS